MAVATRYTRGGVRSRRNVLTRLCAGGVSPRVAHRVVEECQARGLLDDRAGARLWADHWARQGYAALAIRLKLAQKGFEAQAVEPAMARVAAEASDEARARAVISATHRRRRRMSADRHAGRVARALTSRGFDPELIAQLLDELAGGRIASTVS